MRDYAKVVPAFWTRGTGKKLRGHVEAQLVALYLFTAPTANMLGLFYCPIATIAHDTGLTIEGATKGLGRAIEAGLAHFDEEDELVWLPAGVRVSVGDRLEAGDKRCKGLSSDLAKFGNHRFAAALLHAYRGSHHLAVAGLEARAIEAPSQAPSMPGSGSGSGSGEVAGAGAGTLPGDRGTAPADKPAEPKVTASIQRYAEAFAAGMVDAGAEAFTPPTEPRWQPHLAKTAKAHGGGRRGPELDAWIRASAADYRRARADDALFGGFTPENWRKWLDGGRLVASSARPRPIRENPRAQHNPGGLDLPTQTGSEWLLEMNPKGPDT